MISPVLLAKPVCRAETFPSQPSRGPSASITENLESAPIAVLRTSAVLSVD